MKLNYDCCRDVLFYLEENLIIDDTLSTEPINLTALKSSPLIQTYSISDIVYSVQKLDEAGYISAKISLSGKTIYGLTCISITSNGHEFLESIRPESIWQKTKATANSIGSTSFEILKAIAIAAITSKFH